MAASYVWPDDRSATAVLPVVGVLLVTAAAIVALVAREQRSRAPRPPGRLVEAIDLRIAAAERDGPARPSRRPHDRP